MYDYDVSIVLTAHRERHFLRATLLSLNGCAAFSRRRGLRVQLITVFDSADEKTTNAFLGADFSGFASVSSFNVDFRSVGLSRNAGVKEAGGEFIWFADADDLVSQNCIDMLFDQACKQVDHDVVVVPEYFIAFGDDHHIARFERSHFLCAADFAYSHPYVSRVFLKAETFRQLQFRDIRPETGFAYEDWDLNARLFARGFKFEVAPGCIVFYRKRTSSLLRISDTISARLIPHNELFETATFVGLMEDLRSSHPDWDKFTKGRQHLHEHDLVASVLSSPTLRNLIVEASRIEPEIDPRRIEHSSGYCPVPWSDSHWGFALEEALQLAGEKKFTDVVVVPWMAPGGAEKFMLEIVNQLVADGTAMHVLFISGQHARDHGWRDRLPDGSVFIDVQNAFPHLSEQARDDLTARLLLSVSKPGARLHLKPSDVAHRLMDRFAKAFSTHFYVVYYRFSDSAIVWDKQHLRDPWAVRFLRNNFDHINAFISDCDYIVKRDAIVLPELAAKTHRVYARCERIVPVERARQEPNHRLLWASRVAPEKRPELIGSIARNLHRLAPHISIDVYGTLNKEYSADSLFKGAHITYKGGFDGFESLPIEDYDALIYTSAYDGLPNILLEAMAADLAVVAPDVGGISELVSPETGFLVRNHVDEAELVDEYLGCILDLYRDWPHTLSKRQSANQLVQRRHGRDGFRFSVLKAFSSSTVVDQGDERDGLTSVVQVALEASALQNSMRHGLAKDTQVLVLEELPVQCAPWAAGEIRMKKQADIVEHERMTTEQARIKELEAMIRARDKRITELGYLVHSGKMQIDHHPSRFKSFLVNTWDALPRPVQRAIEPFADFVDRTVK